VSDRAALRFIQLQPSAFRLPHFKSVLAIASAGNAFCSEAEAKDEFGVKITSNDLKAIAESLA